MKPLGGNYAGKGAKEKREKLFNAFVRAVFLPYVSFHTFLSMRNADREIVIFGRIVPRCFVSVFY